MEHVIIKRKPPEKHEVWILWSEESCRQWYDTGTIEPSDLKHYEFATLAELNAFLHGVDEAVGWLEHEQFDRDPLKVSA
jgi:hypothetical protein